MEDLKLKSI